MGDPSDRLIIDLKNIIRTQLSQEALTNKFKDYHVYFVAPVYSDNFIRFLKDELLTIMNDEELKRIFFVLSDRYNIDFSSSKLKFEDVVQYEFYHKEFQYIDKHIGNFCKYRPQYLSDTPNDVTYFKHTVTVKYIFYQRDKEYEDNYLPTMDVDITLSDFTRTFVGYTNR